MLVILFIALSVYISMIFFAKYRTPIAVLGAAVLLLYGAISDSFPAHLAFQKFPTEIEILIVVLALFSKIFENTGFLDRVGKKLVNLSKGSRVLIVALLPFVIYSASLFMNNLSVILLFTFICLELTVDFKLYTVPLLTSAVIASNIGGCPLPWADTPAVILTLYTDFNLIDFLNKLFLPCLVYEGLLILYTVMWFKIVDRKRQPSFNQPMYPIIPIRTKPSPYHTPPPPFIMEPRQSPKPPHLLEKETNLSNVKFPIILFVLLIAGICIGPFINLSIAYISIFFGGLLLAVNKDNPEDTLNTLPVLDALVFIASLFFIAGALEYSGILKSFVDYIIAFSADNSLLILLCIMLSAFTIATFLSAGPAAATILPICNQLSPIVGDKLVYAALALGILAGSSMLPWSATGGPILLAEVNRFLKRRKLQPEDINRISEIFIIKKYLAFTIPFSLIILTLSAIFLTLYFIY